MATPSRIRTNNPSTRRCLNCSMHLRANMRTRLIQELNEKMSILLRSWVAPSLVSSEDKICNECYAILQERALSNSTSLQDFPPAFGHLNICYGCGISIASRRTHNVAIDCPQRSFILRWTPAHHVTRLENVCHPCWEAATRRTRRHDLWDTNRPAVNVVQSITTEVIEAAIPEPPPMPPPVLNPLNHEQQFTRTQPKIHSSKYKRVAATSRHCLFNGCENIERLLVPNTVKEVLLLQYKIYIPLCARICHHHLHSNEWEELSNTFTDFTAFQVDDIFSRLEKAAKRHLDFNNINLMDPHLCHYWLGLSAKEFHDLLNSIPMLNDQDSNPSVALSALLIKLRTGDSNERLSTLFNLSRTTLERKMNSARRCLSEQLNK